MIAYSGRGFSGLAGFLAEISTNDIQMTVSGYFEDIKQINRERQYTYK